MNENFVFFLPEEDYYRIPYYELNELCNVEIVDALIDSKNKLLRMFYLFCFSTKINALITIPGKKIWFKTYYKNHNKIKPNYFVFFDAQLRKCTCAYRNYLKKTYPDCKIVLFLTDLIRSFKCVDICTIKKFADLILTYDKNDALNYDLHYYPDVYSKLPADILDSEYKSADLLFAGYKKNRGTILEQLAETIHGTKLVADFYIPDYKENIQANHFLLKTMRIPYIEYLKKLQRTNCVLEVQQKGATGYTLRTLEAITYNKKLLTNNVSIKDAPFYNDKYIQIFNEIECIDFSWVNQVENVNYQNTEQYKPRKLLEYIREYFALKP